MLRRPCSFFVVALAIGARSLSGQAPRITQSGDPSVKADTIYKLAVDAAAHPEEDIVYLLDDGVVRVEADGRGTQTFRQIVQVLKPEAVERYREFSFSYAPKHERFTLNWIRVLKPNGEVISGKPSHEQDADVPAQMGDPVYSDRKVKRLSVSGVEPGVIVDYSYTREELKPFLAGDFFQSWSVSTGRSVKRSRFILDAPANLAMRINEKNLNFARTTTTAGGRRIYTWATRDLAKTKGEVFAADSNNVSMSVAVSSPLSWQDIGKWYAVNAKDRYAVGPAASKKLAAVIAGAKTRDDTIRAVHRWVAQDIRYVSIALGLGGYQPRTPDDVVSTGFGDCKDKATLFVASLNKLGIPALPVLLNASGVEYRDLPSIEQLDHAIAAVPLPAGRGYQFTDLTSELTPYGELPYAEQGELALVVHPDGTTEEMSMPRTEPVANFSEIRISGALSPTGSFDGRYDERATGSLQYGLREAFEHPMDTAQVRKVVNTLAGKYFDGADGDSLVAFDGKDLSTTPHLSFLIKHGKATSSAGTSEIFTIPIGNMGGMLQAARELESATPRVFPLDAERVFGNRASLVEVRVKLPAGWKAQLPPNISAKSVFGSYESEYAQDGNELRITRRTAGARGIFPPDQVQALASWFRAIAKDDAKLIVLSKS